MPDVTTHTGRPIPTPAARSLTTPVRKRSIKVAREEQQKKKKKSLKERRVPKSNNRTGYSSCPFSLEQTKKKEWKQQVISLTELWGLRGGRSCTFLARIKSKLLLVVPPSCSNRWLGPKESSRCRAPEGSRKWGALRIVLWCSTLAFQLCATSLPTRRLNSDAIVNFNEIFDCGHGEDLPCFVK